MNTRLIGYSLGVAFAGIVLLFAARSAQSQNAPGAFVDLVASPTGPIQTGSLHISSVASAGLFKGSGAGLINLAAPNIATGLLDDARLGPNVPLINRLNTFGAVQRFASNVLLTSQISTVMFPAVAPGAVKPMMTMFASGTSNSPRMVLAHSPNLPTWGLQYDDSTDTFSFLGNGTSALTVDLANLWVGIGTATPTAKFHSNDQLLANGAAVARISYGNGDDLFSGTGLDVVSTPYINKGSQKGVVATSGLNMSSNQGSATGILASSSAFAASGSNMGVSGSATTTSIGNFGAGNISYSLGGRFTADVANINFFGKQATGTYWLGGVMGQVNGPVNTTQTLGAVAGVIGIDNNTGSAPSWAGYFSGKVFSTVDYFGSDGRYKENVETLRNAVGIIQSLRGVAYDWKQDLPVNLKYEPGRHIGFIAQEVQEVLPILVEGSEESIYSVNYSGVIPILVEAVKEQQREINAIRAENEALRTELREFMAEVRAKTK